MSEVSRRGIPTGSEDLERWNIAPRPLACWRRAPSTGRRIGLEPAAGDGEPIFAGFKHGAFSLYFGDEPIYHFDLEGRWQRAYIEGLHYPQGARRRSPRDRPGARGPEPGPPPPEVELRRGRRPGRPHPFGRPRPDGRRWTAGDSVAGSRRSARPSRSTDDELREFLERISRWDAAAWFAHRERYTGTYGPLPFLPPECQNAVVLQATLGHAGGRTFGLSPAAEPYVRSADEFSQHAREVAGLWGRRLLQSRLIFLAGGDVLYQPAEQVVAYLDHLAGRFPSGIRTRRPTSVSRESMRSSTTSEALDSVARSGDGLRSGD